MVTPGCLTASLPPPIFIPKSSPHSILSSTIPNPISIPLLSSYPYVCTYPCPLSPSPPSSHYSPPFPHPLHLHFISPPLFTFLPLTPPSPPSPFNPLTTLSNPPHLLLPHPLPRLSPTLATVNCFYLSSPLHTPPFFYPCSPPSPYLSLLLPYPYSRLITLPVPSPPTTLHPFFHTPPSPMPLLHNVAIQLPPLFTPPYLHPVPSTDAVSSHLPHSPPPPLLRPPFSPHYLPFPSPSHTASHTPSPPIFLTLRLPYSQPLSSPSTPPTMFSSPSLYNTPPPHSLSSGIPPLRRSPPACSGERERNAGSARA